MNDRPDTVDLPLGGRGGPALRVRIVRDSEGWPYAVKIGEWWPGDGGDPPEDWQLIEVPLDALGQIGAHVRQACADHHGLSLEEWKARKVAT